MIQRLNVKAQISTLSLGQVGYNILRELYRRKIQVCFFARQVDFSPFKPDPSFQQWIERSINSRYEKLDRKVPTLNIWHLQGSEDRLSDKQVTLSFHETDSPTPSEIGVANHQDLTLFTSRWSVDNFKTYGATNVDYVPLGLDEDFTPSEQRLVPEDVTHWILCGKFEELRKMTGYKIRTWMKKYGGNPKHLLSICVDNPFYIRERNRFNTEDLLNQIFQGNKPFNINVLPHLKTNAEMLQLYRSADLDLSGFSRAEGHNIPAHTVTALGKWSIVSNCSAHKDWATLENSILIEPNGMVKAIDNFFFFENSPFSSGNMFAFSDESFVNALERAEKMARIPNINGQKLAEITYSKTVNTILNKIA